MSHACAQAWQATVGAPFGIAASRTPRFERDAGVSRSVAIEGTVLLFDGFAQHRTQRS